MRLTAWRILLWAMICAGFCTAAYDLIYPASDPSSALGIVTTQVSGYGGPAFRVSRVRAGSEASRAHIRTGDVIMPKSNFAWYSNAVPRAMRASVYTGRHTRVVILHVDSVQAIDWSFVAWSIFRIATLIIITVMVIVRVDDPDARILSLALLGPASVHLYFDMPPPFDTAALLDRYVAHMMSLPAFVVFGTRFPARPWRGTTAVIAAVGIPVALFTSCVQFAGDWMYFKHGAEIWPALAAAHAVTFTATLLLTWLALGVGLRSERGERRERIAWMMLTVGVATSGTAVTQIGSIFGLNFSVVEIATFFLLPFGLGYALLQRRVLDLGFAVNRTLIFGLLTTTLLPLFAIVEWLADHYVSAQSHEASIALQVGIALGLFFSFRWLHAKAEWIVDELFFRKRRQHERALHEIASELAFVDDPATIVQLAMDAVLRHADAPSAAVYEVSGTSIACCVASAAEFPASVADVDRGVLALRTRRGTVEAPQESVFAGSLLLPYFHAADLHGFIVCASRASHEAFDPDEREALATLAAGVGLALERTRLHAAESRVNELRTELALAQREIDVLRALSATP